MRPTGGVHHAVDGLLCLAAGLLFGHLAWGLLRGRSLRINGRPLSLAARPLAGRVAVVTLGLGGLGAGLIGLLRLLNLLRG